MRSNLFSIRAAVSYGWGGAVSHLRFFALVVLIVFAVGLLPQIVELIFGNDFGLLYLLVFPVYIVLQFLVGLGIVRISIDFVKSRRLRLSHLFSQYLYIFPYILASLLIGIPIFVLFGFLIILSLFGGEVFELTQPVFLLVLIFCIALVVYLTTRLQFYSYFIIDKKAGPVESLRLSYFATQGIFWKVFFLGVVLNLINLLGALLFLVGLFVTIPLEWLARAHVYNRISASNK